MKGVEIQNWIEKKVSKKWKISNGVIWKNIEKDGENAYALLNILTDSASNFDHDLGEVESLNFIDSRHEAEDRSSNSERANRQRKVGKFLENLIEEINNVNQIINSPEFKINDENINLFDNLKVKASYKLDIGIVKF